MTPLTPLEILIGKAVPVSPHRPPAVDPDPRHRSFHRFRSPMAGSLLDLYLGLLVFTTACVGIPACRSAGLSSNIQQAMVYTFIIMMPLILLSGLHHAYPQHATETPESDPTSTRCASPSTWCAGCTWKAPSLADIPGTSFQC
ncbi:hypothetical protein ACPA9J_27210 [Pseudomonas aeruginosa]